MTHILIIKKSGEKEPFSEEKVIKSLQHVGLPHGEYAAVLEEIKTKLHEGITTEEIFSYIRSRIGKKNQQASLRLNLKQAIFELGPTGFPFEKYIGRIFQDQGYRVQTDLIMNGECITHEVDVLLEQNGRREFVEAKFHNQAGIKTDIHVMMYTLARYWDLREINHLAAVWVVTNTKLSEDAIKYARCKGIKVIAWNFPEENNLQHFAEKPRMYPVSILPLSSEEKQKLLQDNIILCSDFLKTTEKVLRDKYFIKPERIERAIADAKLVSLSA